jgi:hypothetical protein
MVTGSPHLTGFIHLLVQNNPKRGASKAIFACYRGGMSVTELAEALKDPIKGRKVTAAECIKWDTDPKRRYIEVLATAELCFQRAIGDLRERLAKLEGSAS